MVTNIEEHTDPHVLINFSRAKSQKSRLPIMSASRGFVNQVGQSDLLYKTGLILQLSETIFDIEFFWMLFIRSPVHSARKGNGCEVMFLGSSR